MTAEQRAGEAERHVHALDIEFRLTRRGRGGADAGASASGRESDDSPEVELGL